jgi:hypothetical protein
MGFAIVTSGCAPRSLASGGAGGATVGAGGTTSGTPSSGSPSVTSAATSTVATTGTTANVSATAATTSATGMTAAATGATSASATSSATSSATGMGAPCPVGADLNQVVLYSNPPDLASWPTTTALTEVDFTNNGVHTVFSKEDGTGRWPDVTPPGWTGPLQYTVGMVECIDGQWYGSAVIEFWYGLAAEGGNVAQNNQVAMNWYYDANRWGKLAGRQPAPGETIGIFVAAGNLRNVTSDDPAQSPVMERSNVVYMPFPDVNGSTNSF